MKVRVWEIRLEKASDMGHLWACDETAVVYLLYMLKLSRILFGVFALVAPIAEAHPHVFVTTRIVLELDDARRVSG
ncbi:MAG: hypothetical protein WBC85_17155, partial [Planktotalea sp.]